MPVTKEASFETKKRVAADREAGKGRFVESADFLLRPTLFEKARERSRRTSATESIQLYASASLINFPPLTVGRSARALCR